MRRISFLVFLLFAFATLEGCVTSEPDSPALYVGMSRDRLRTRFGDPIHVEHASSGGEDWYYSVTSWRNSDVQGDVYKDGDSQSASVSVTISDDNTREQPVHLSPDGYVVAPLPSGKIVPK